MHRDSASQVGTALRGSYGKLPLHRIVCTASYHMGHLGAGCCEGTSAADGDNFARLMMLTEPQSAGPDGAFCHTATATATAAAASSVTNSLTWIP